MRSGSREAFGRGATVKMPFKAFLDAFASGDDSMYLSTQEV